MPGHDGEADDRYVEGAFAQYPTAREQAVLALLCFLRTEPGGDRTRLAAGSHHAVTRELWRADPNMTGKELISVVGPKLDHTGWDVGEVVTEARAVVLAHPLLVHSSAPNGRTHPHVISQLRYDLCSPRRLDGDCLSAVGLQIGLQRGR